MSVNSDFKELLSIFNDYQVKYLVIGGYAVIQYTEPRYTKDLDIWISTEKENARAVFMALCDFGAPLVGLTEDDFAYGRSRFRGRPDHIYFKAGLDHVKIGNRSSPGSS
jgi:hypothetical protein